MQTLRFILRPLFARTGVRRLGLACAGDLRRGSLLLLAFG
jgi:hypothetical protein